MKIHHYILLLITCISFSTGVQSQNKDSRVRRYIPPTRIVWQFDGNNKLVESTDILLKQGNGQSDLGNNPVCIIRSKDNEQGSILLDFGKEIQGGIRIVTGKSNPASPIKIRVCFGESVSEAMSAIGDGKGSTNDHAMRDYETDLPWLGVLETGNTGFRFVRIDLLTPDAELALKEINAVSVYRDIPYQGSFRCNDERLNNIWRVGAYTVHVNMQEYLWDGIKRDRLVWIGDMHPEVMTINSVFGYNDVVPKSLDLTRDITPLPEWMNGINSYSLWWVLIHADWYKYQGDLNYLKEQQPYMVELLKILLTKVDGSGKEMLDGQRFLDWPSEANKEGVSAGLQALLLMTLESGGDLCLVLGETQLANDCKAKAQLMRNYVPDPNQSKQGASLMALAGLMDAQKANDEIISIGGAKNFSTFYGYYMLQAQAKAGEYQTALDNIRTYWGAMLDMGATTFWEDFDLEWLPDAAPIDELVPEGKKDIHVDFGAYCYKNLRHSLSHGWASGPTAWMSEHVLGVKVVEAGCKTIEIEPHLGDLEWVEGSFPTPYGVVKISHKKVNGKIKTEVNAPKKVKVIFK